MHFCEVSESEFVDSAMGLPTVGFHKVTPFQIEDFMKYAFFALISFLSSFSFAAKTDWLRTCNSQKHQVAVPKEHQGLYRIEPKVEGDSRIEAIWVVVASQGIIEISDHAFEPFWDMSNIIESLKLSDACQKTKLYKVNKYKDPRYGQDLVLETEFKSSEAPALGLMSSKMSYNLKLVLKDSSPIQTNAKEHYSQFIRLAFIPAAAGSKTKSKVLKTSQVVVKSLEGIY